MEQQLKVVIKGNFNLDSLDKTEAKAFLEAILERILKLKNEKVACKSD